MPSNPLRGLEQFEVRTRGALDAAVRPPGSKSITNRALTAAALATGESFLYGALASDDTEAMLECLKALGCRVTTAGDTWRVPGRAGRLNAPGAPLFTRNSGTTIRFLTAAASLAAAASLECHGALRAEVGWPWLRGGRCRDKGDDELGR